MAAPAEKCPTCGAAHVIEYYGAHRSGATVLWRRCEAGHLWNADAPPREPGLGERLTNLEAGLSALLAWAEEADAGAAVRTGLREKIANFETRRPT